MIELFWKIILLRAHYAAACVATYTYDFPAYNVPITTTQPTTTPAPCPAGWSLFGNNCFIVVTDRVNGNVAPGRCVSLGGALASIHSLAENAFAQALLPSGPARGAWIGGYRFCPTTFTNACFRNRDGTPFDYGNFGPGQPNNQANIENCVFMFKMDGVWDDYFCDIGPSSLLPYVCEKPRV